MSRILDEKNPLFDSLTDKIQTDPDLRNLLFDLLMNGKPIAFVPDNPAIDSARMFGFVCEKDRKAVIANRIFETRLG